MQPMGWSGCDFVKAVQLRSNNLPVDGIPSNPTHLRGCRAGCQKMESISHVLQNCPANHFERIRRHNEIVRKIASHCLRNNWVTEVEPHVRHTSGQLFKPDLAIHIGNEVARTDVGVNWEGTQPLAVTVEAKRAVYENRTFKLNKRILNLSRCYSPRGQCS